MEGVIVGIDAEKMQNSDYPKHSERIRPAGQEKRKKKGNKDSSFLLLYHLFFTGAIPGRASEEYRG